MGRKREGNKKEKRETERVREGEKRQKGRKVGKHGLIPDAAAIDQSQTDGVGRSGGASIKLQNISLTHTHTRTRMPFGNKSTCLFHLFDSVAIYMRVRLHAANNKHVNSSVYH